MNSLRSDAPKSGSLVLIAGILVYLLAVAVSATAAFAHGSARAADACVILFLVGLMLLAWPLASWWVEFKRRLAGLPARTALEEKLQPHWRTILGVVLLATVVAAIAAAMFGLPIR
jgi:hypothetical protein